MRRHRRNHSAAFKAKLALEAVWGKLPLAELADQDDVHTTQIAQRKSDLVKGAEAVFDSKQPDKPDIDVQRLHAKFGELTLANDFLKARSALVWKFQGRSG